MGHDPHAPAVRTLRPGTSRLTQRRRAPLARRSAAPVRARTFHREAHGLVLTGLSPRCADRLSERARARLARHFVFDVRRLRWVSRCSSGPPLADALAVAMSLGLVPAQAPDEARGAAPDEAPCRLRATAAGPGAIAAMVATGRESVAGAIESLVRAQSLPGLDAVMMTSYPSSPLWLNDGTITRLPGFTVVRLRSGRGVAPAEHAVRVVEAAGEAVLLGPFPSAVEAGDALREHLRTRTLRAKAMAA